MLPKFEKRRVVGRKLKRARGALFLEFGTLASDGTLARGRAPFLAFETRALGTTLRSFHVDFVDRRGRGLKEEDVTANL